MTKWRDRFLQRAKDEASWSKDPSKQIGSIIVNPEKRNILSSGYNGFPRGIEDSHERLHNRDLKYKYVVHSEMNAIFNASYVGACLDGAHIYVYGLPICSECAKGIVQVGIKHAVMLVEEPIRDKWSESWELTKEIFDEAGVTYELVIKDE